MTLLDGRELARRLTKALAPRIARVKKARGSPPMLAVFSAGADPAAKAYLAARLKACREAGLEAEARLLSAGAGLAEALRGLTALADDPQVDAVIVDQPLPKSLSAADLLAALPEGKDAEGVGPASFGRLFLAKSFDGGLIAPPTALAIAALARASGARLAGRRAVVVGRSSIVGRPAAHLLSGLDMTVTLCHSKTAALEDEIRRADLVVACLGVPGLIKAPWIKKGAIVIDAGATTVGGRVRGDVEAGAAKQAAFLTPVPGGVGPVTVAMLLTNTVTLAERRLKA